MGITARLGSPIRFGSLVFLLAAWTTAQDVGAAPALVARAHVFAGRTITFAPLAVSGLAAATGVSVTGGTYSVGCLGPFVASAGVIANGQVVCVRHQSNESAGASVETILTIGDNAYAFRSTTAADPAYALIAGFYRTILGREADEPGLAYWRGRVTLMQSLDASVNDTWRAVTIAFFGSLEYRALGTTDTEYVEKLYWTFFDRAPDPAGLAYWAGQLAAGVPRDAALISFLFSPEFVAYAQSIFGTAGGRVDADLVVDFYRGFLNRFPDEAGLRHWRARVRAAQCAGAAAVASELEAMSHFFLESAEYASRVRDNGGYVTDLYNALFRRGEDLGGTRYWQGRLDMGELSREQLRRAFLESEEFQGRVGQVAALGCPSLAAESNLTASFVSQGVSPFIAFMGLGGRNLERIASVTFIIAPKAGSVSRPVSANYPASYLQRTGYGLAFATGYTVPVFGLYASHANTVSMAVTFEDGSVKDVVAAVETPAFVDPTGIYDRPNILQRRTTAADGFGFDFFYVKTFAMGPIVFDTDGEVRWWAPGSLRTFSTIFDGNSFVSGDAVSMRVRRTELDGSTVDRVVGGTYQNFHHAIDKGKRGLLMEVDDLRNGVLNIETVLLEVDSAGVVLKEWDLARIVSDHMRSLGDDPSTFVRAGVDWFHMNAAAYDPTDDSLIISSRENFLIKIDYETGRLHWVFGDPTKYWYSFPSLRARSIALQPGSRYPIGQHAVSVTADGLVMVFNNGRGSLFQPAGAPAGEERAYSAVSGYAIDPITRTAREVLMFDHARRIRSSYCSSAYEAGESLLVSYAQADNATRARLVGVDFALQIVFDFEFASTGCQTSWNAAPISFGEMTFR